MNRKKRVIAAILGPLFLLWQLGFMSVAQETPEGNARFSIDAGFFKIDYSPTISISDSSVPPGGASSELLVHVGHQKMTVKLDLPGIDPTLLRVDPFTETSLRLRWPGTVLGAIPVELVLKGSLEYDLSTFGHVTARPGMRSITLVSTPDSVDGEWGFVGLHDFRFLLNVRLVFGDFPGLNEGYTLVGSNLASQAPLFLVSSVHIVENNPTEYSQWGILLTVLVVTVTMLCIVGRKGSPRQ